MKCPICRAEVESDAKYCTSCGKQIDGKEVTGVISTSTTTTTPPATTESNGKLVIILIVVLGVLFIFGLVIPTIIGSTLTKLEKENSATKNQIIKNYVEKNGEVVKTIVDPKGHEIILKYDSVYLIKTETSYLYDKKDEMFDNAKISTKSDIIKLDATEKQKKATLKARNYLIDSAAYDKKEVIKKLKKAGYDQDTVDFAIANCGADWNERATIRAMSFLASGGFSKQELINILEYVGYSKEEATAAANNEEIDYYEQAVYDACFAKYTEKSYSESYSREDAEQSLKYAEYSDEEIEFALKTIYDELDY